MTHQLGLKSWATGALVLAAVSACGGTSADPTTPSSLAPTTTTSSSAIPSSPSEKAAADATAMLRHYFATLDSVRQNNAIPISQLSSVMTSIELRAEKRLVTQERTKDLHQTGSTAIDELKLQSIDLDNSDPSSGKAPTAVIDACWDVSKADLVDKDGKSVVSPTRPDRMWTRYTVTNYQWAENPSAGWRVASSQDLKQAPCVAP